MIDTMMTLNIIIADNIVGKPAPHNVHPGGEQCKNPVFDQAVYGADPKLRQQARRGRVVLTDRMYRVCGPDGERQVCQPCIKRCHFRWHDEDAEDV